MDKQPLFHLVSTSFCQALMLEEWDAVPGRFYVAYKSRGDFARLLGHGVVDEFRTISGPVLLSPATIMGGIYDSGMQLADARDAEAPIDQGWPPLTIGMEVEAPERPPDWQEQFLRAIQQMESTGTAPWDFRTDTLTVGGFQVSALRCSVRDQSAASIFATNAHMLPQQLARLADVGRSGISVAISTGNRLPRIANGALHQVTAISERQLDDIMQALDKAL